MTCVDRTELVELLGWKKNELQVTTMFKHELVLSYQTQTEEKIINLLKELIFSMIY